MRIVTLDSVASTNDEAKRLLAEGERDVCVVAREQTGGRGTRGRAWVSPRDAGVYLSVGRAMVAAPVTTLYALAAGVACAERIEAACGARVELKPVNDLVLAGGKLGGVLVETVVERGGVVGIVVGVGVNVRRAERVVTAAALPPVCLEDVCGAAGALALEAPGFAPALADDLVAWIGIAASGGLDRIRDAWECRTIAGGEFPEVG